MTPTDRTQTAHLSPFSTQEVAETPLLLLCLRAQGSIDDRERMVVPSNGLVLGRRPAGAGRAAPGFLYLDDPLASSNHARLQREGEVWTLVDLGSKNGTFVDGERLGVPVELKDGARIFVGNHGFVFRLASAQQIEAIKAELSDPLGPVATVSPRLAMLCSKLRRLAPSSTEVLLSGETGVGKEVYAHALHARSGRPGRFVALNCAAIPRELVESELFGYRQGAHSTAQSAKAGLIEQAEGGTLFLDEIGEMSVEAQTKLLRFLQDRHLTPLGSTRPRLVDVRVIAATNRDVVPGASGAVRDDLLGRLGAAPVRIPPLRERIEDVGRLVLHFLAHHGLGGTPVPLGVDLAAARAMMLARYPLNVRELEKMIAAAVALSGPAQWIGLGDLPETLTAPPPVVAEQIFAAQTYSGRKPPEPAPAAEELERLLRVHDGNVADVARAVGRQRAAVWRWLKRYGLEPKVFKE